MQMDNATVFNKIKAEVEALAACPVPSDDEDIFKSGILDSLNILNIIVFIENEFDIKINPFEVNLETLGSINNICEFVNAKVQIP